MLGDAKGWIGWTAPEEGKIHDVVLRSKGRGWGNCKFCKITDGNHGDVTGIYRKKGFLKGEALRLLELRACLHRGGGPRVGEVTHLGGVNGLTLPSLESLILIWSRLHDRWGDHMRDCMDSRVTPPKRVTLPAWGHLPPYNQPLLSERKRWTKQTRLWTRLTFNARSRNIDCIKFTDRNDALRNKIKQTK